MARIEDERRAWVKDQGARRRRETEIQEKLVGRRIKKVRYIELAYEGQPGPMWHAGALWDSVDHGLEIDLDNDQTWSIIWKQHGPNEALLVYEGLLRPAELLPDAGTYWDVTDHWHALGPHFIARVSTVWTRHSFGPALNSAREKVAEAGESDLCLTTLILRGDDEREAAITLGEDHGDGLYRWSATSVAVFFSVAEARKAGAMMPGDPDIIE